MTQFKTLTELTEFIEQGIQTFDDDLVAPYYGKFKLAMTTAYDLDAKIKRLSDTEDWSCVETIIDHLEALKSDGPIMLDIHDLILTLESLGEDHINAFHEYYTPMVRFVNAVNYYVNAKRTLPHQQAAIIDGLIVVRTEYRNVVTGAEDSDTAELLTKAALTQVVWSKLSKYVDYSNINDRRLGMIYMDITGVHHNYISNPRKLLYDIDFNIMHISTSSLPTNNPVSVSKILLDAEAPAWHILKIRKLLDGYDGVDRNTDVGAEVRRLVRTDQPICGLDSMLTTLLERIDLNTQSYWKIGQHAADMVNASPKPDSVPTDKVERIQLFNRIYQLYAALMDSNSKKIGHTNRLELFGRTVAAYIEQFYMAGHR